MKFMVRLLGALVLAVAVALLARSNAGYVLVFLPPWRIDLSFNFFILLDVLLFLALLAAGRLARVALKLPGSIRAGRRRFQRRGGRRSLALAWQAYAAGDFETARLQAAAAGQVLEHATAWLLAAQAAQQSGQGHLAADYMAQAQRLASTPDSDQAF